MVVFNFEATVEGKPFEGNKGEKLQIVLGKDLFIPGFDKQILVPSREMKKLQKLSCQKTILIKILAGSQAEFKCKIVEVKKSEE